MGECSDNVFYCLQGTHGLSLFYVETRNANGDLNGIQIQVPFIIGQGVIM